MKTTTETENATLPSQPISEDLPTTMRNRFDSNYQQQQSSTVFGDGKELPFPRLDLKPVQFFSFQKLNKKG